MTAAFKPPPSCVTPQGQFQWGLHRPRFTVSNLRRTKPIETLGHDADGRPLENEANFPAGDIRVDQADPIYEIPNAFPFRGATYIAKSWADRVAADPQGLIIAAPPACSLAKALEKTSAIGNLDPKQMDDLYANLPDAVRLALATCSTDPAELCRLAHLSCAFCLPAPQAGLRFEKRQGQPAAAVIHDEPLFEAVANNPHLPNGYKRAMVLRPGIQGQSEITGESGGRGQATHVWEYVRRNSYIPWGHYAANMADDAIRYELTDLQPEDMQAMRRLYFQRTLMRLAKACGLSVTPPPDQETLGPKVLESLRQQLLSNVNNLPPDTSLPFDSHLWGWNFGFDYAPSHFRLHASHQQIHQQYALIPASVPNATGNGSALNSYACGDLVFNFMEQYERSYGCRFFEAYLKALESNQRTDGDPHKPQSLIVYGDDHVVLFVPKAQTSQFELQIMTRGPVGNLLEADPAVRASLDRTLYLAVKALAALGVRMITTIEYAKRFSRPDRHQHLLYALLPKIPWSMGAFSEAQLRWIMGHYPEDFADLVRDNLPDEKQ